MCRQFKGTFTNKMATTLYSKTVFKFENNAPVTFEGSWRAHSKNIMSTKCGIKRLF